MPNFVHGGESLGSSRRSSLTHAGRGQEHSAWGWQGDADALRDQHRSAGAFSLPLASHSPISSPELHYYRLLPVLCLRVVPGWPASRPAEGEAARVKTTDFTHKQKYFVLWFIQNGD